MWTMLSGFSPAAPATAALQQLDNQSGRAECVSCHGFPATRTHVVGVRPTFDVPAEYPLDADGQMTCLTCHDAMRGSASSARSSVRGSSRGSSFCRTCHRVAAEDGSRIAHAVRRGIAHASNPPDRRGTDSRRSTAASLDCLGCHDGVIGEGGHWTPRPGLVRRGLDSGHPTGVSYAEGGRSSSRLVPAVLLNPALRLESGAVGCTSCHDAFSSVANQLVIENRGSALCTSCHKV